MGRLFFTDRGRVTIHHNEEITRWRWAKKVLQVPPEAVGSPADLWMLLSCYQGNKVPLVVQVNRKAAGEITAEQAGGATWSWVKWRIPAKLLREGKNEIVLSADTPAMNAWTLAMESVPHTPRSWLSLDGGKTWQNRHMGAHGILRGEYLIRLRSHSPKLHEHRLPQIIYEDPAHPRVQELRNALPTHLRKMRDSWKQLLALRTWVATRWQWDSSGPVYTPWDPMTIIDWGNRKSDHHGQRRGRIVMCVHFGVVFASFAAALGHRARCVAITQDINSWKGHFVTEVFDERTGRWIIHDANYDVHYEDGLPLSGVDLAERAIAGKDCTDLVRSGPGMPTTQAGVMSSFRQYFATGVSYRVLGIWTHNNFVSDPTVAPPGHGNINYCETDFIWYAPAELEEDATAMFPYRCRSREKLTRPA